MRDKNQLEICEKYGHNYKLVFHDEKSVTHTSYLVCSKCGKGIIVDKFKRVEE